PEFNTIKNLPIGQVHGVYTGHFQEEPTYESNYILAKITSTTLLPDSVKFRHLLIALPKEPTEEQILTARVKVDSLYSKLKKGENFQTLIQQYSEDQDSKEKGGEYILNYEQGLRLDSSLFNALFKGKVRTLELVKTAYGYHIIEVLSQTHFQKLYKVAIASRKIEASPETISQAVTKASQLKAIVGMKSTTSKFINDAQKLNLKVATTSQPVPSSIASPFVNNLYSKEILGFMYKNDKNAVSDPIKVGNDYIIAILTNVYQEEKGSLPAIIDYLTDKEKKDNAYAMVSKQVGSTSLLVSIEEQYKQKIEIASQVSFLNLMFASEGIEPNAVGTCFNSAAWNTVSKPIKGNTGIFFIKTIHQPYTLQNEDLSTFFLNKEASMINNVFTNLYSNLTRNSTVKDYRNKFL
ncbi:MAG: peptidylprolyl isomerase, partial [Chitinophagaceae bacterium]